MLHVQGVSAYGKNICRSMDLAQKCFADSHPPPLPSPYRNDWNKCLRTLATTPPKGKQAPASLRWQMQTLFQQV